MFKITLECLVACCIVDKVQTFENFLQEASCFLLKKVITAFLRLVVFEICRNTLE